MADETTIGYAVLQIIPSLKGVSETIEKEIAGQVVPITIEAKVDTSQVEASVQDAVDKAKPPEVRIEPKIDPGQVQKQAEDAGKGAAKELRDQINDALKQSADEFGVTLDELKDQIAEDDGIRDALHDAIVDGLKDAAKDAGVSVDQLSKQVDEALRGAIKKSKPPEVVIKPRIDPEQVNEEAEQAGQGVGNVLRDIINEGLQGAADDMGVTVDQLKKKIGDKVGGAIGESIGKALGNSPIGDVVRGVADQVDTVRSNFNLARDAVEAFKGKDINGGLRGAEQLARNLGIDISGTTGPLGDMATRAEQTRGKIQDIGSTFSDMPGKVGKVGTAISNLAGPLSVALTGADELLNRLDQVPAIHDRFFNPDGSHKNPIDRWFDRNLPGLTNALPGPHAPPDQTGSQPGWTDIRPAPNQLPDPGLRGPSLPVPGRIARPGDVGPDGRPLIPGQVVPGHATGGQIMGSGSGISDSILVRVSNGEYIVNADATRKNLPLLEFINSQKLPGFAGGGLVAGSEQLRQIIMQRFGISNIGGYSAPDGFNEHSTGRALDVMVGNDKAKGDAVKDFALANASAIDLKWAIWQQQMWYPGGRSEKMGDRGSPTQNHMDHVHIFSGTGITNGLLGNLQGGGGAAVPKGMGVGDGPSAPSALSGVGAAAPAAATGTGGSGGTSGGFSLPSSFSDLAGFGLNGLGKGIGATKSGSDLSLFGNAAGAAVSGQVSSALSGLGIPGAPSWLGAVSKFVGGLSFGGGGASPVSAAMPAAAAAIPSSGPAAVPSSLGVNAGQQPGVQNVWNIQTARVEDAFIRAKRISDEQALSKVGQYI